MALKPIKGPVTTEAFALSALTDNQAQADTFTQLYLYYVFVVLNRISLINKK